MTLRDDVNDRVWYENKTKTSFVFLVDKPITFGHSQLVMSISSGTHEEEIFRSATKHITVCIRTFRSTLMRLNLGEWCPLAQYTETSEDYVKTLVLKASAQEDRGKFKVHLLPCFSSHIESANSLFRERFGKNEAGGLL